jgi:hypothetical protein
MRMMIWEVKGITRERENPPGSAPIPVEGVLSTAAAIYVTVRSQCILGTKNVSVCYRFVPFKCMWNSKRYQTVTVRSDHRSA